MRNLVIIVMLGVAAFAVSQYALPAWQNVVVLREELKRIEDVKAQAEEVTAARDALLARYHDVTEVQKERLNALLPKKIEAEELYVFFKTFVPTTGITFNNVNIDNATAAADPNQTGQSVIGFKLDVAGSYANVRSFLDGVENNLRLMDIDSVGITSSSDSSGQFGLTVHGKLYYGN